MDYPFNFTAVIDLLCIVPIIFKFSPLREWLADLLYGQLFTGLYFLRIIRTKRLVTVGRIYTKFLPMRSTRRLRSLGSTSSRSS